MLKMARNLQINWLLVAVIAICVGNVVCKPATKNIKRNIQEVNSASEDPSTDEEALGENPVRRSGSTAPEDESIDSGNESKGGVFFDAADWVKEAEEWAFKGGDWGLVTLPNDEHPDIPAPPVPGPVLIAEGNSMRKVIVSRSEENLENLTLHFSYFLSNNPRNPPVLEVYQIQDDTHSERVSVEATYGVWTTSTISLPYSGKFEIKFIGQRIVDSNEIVLDDIVLRGYYMNEDTESQDTSPQVSDEGDLTGNTNTQVTDNDDQAKGNETQVDDEDNEDEDNVTLGTAKDDQEIKANVDDWNDIYDDAYSGDGYYDTKDKDYDNDNGWFFYNWLNNNDDNSNSTEDSNQLLDSIGAIEVSEISGEIEDAGAGGAMIMFSIVSVLGVVLLGFAYWRRSQSGSDEKTIFNRGATTGQNDFDRLMYSDVPYEDDNTNGKNYKSFD